MNKHSTKDKIIDISRVLFIESGFENISVNKIIKKMNIAKGTFYHHFESKEHLIGSVIDQIMNDYFEELKKRLTLYPDEPLKTLNGLFRYMKETEEESGKLTEFVHRAENKSFHDRIVSSFNNKIYSLITPVIKKGMELKIFDICYPEKTTYTIVNFMFLVGHQKYMCGLEDQLNNPWKPEEVEYFVNRLLGSEKNPVKL